LDFKKDKDSVLCELGTGVIICNLCESVAGFLDVFCLHANFKVVSIFEVIIACSQAALPI